MHYPRSVWLTTSPLTINVQGFASWTETKTKAEKRTTSGRILLQRGAPSARAADRTTTLGRAGPNSVGKGRAAHRPA